MPLPGIDLIQLRKLRIQLPDALVRFGMLTCKV